MKTPLKEQGAMDRFFLLDTVRHISRNFELDNKAGQSNIDDSSLLSS
jgi:hypothetical protein